MRNFRQIWRHRLFRRLFFVKLTTQAADGCLQVGMAAYVLFSPTDQPNAWAIAGVLAVTLLPFSAIGPLVGVLLDRWHRQRVIVITDLIRVGIATALTCWVAAGVRTAWSMAVFFALILIAMSLNRFLMAGLTASLAHTVDRKEYLLASSLIAPLGPLGVVVAAALAAIVRFSTAGALATHHADAIMFAVAAAGFLTSALLATRVGRGEFGPQTPRTGQIHDVLTNLRTAAGHLRRRRAALFGLIALGCQRTIYGAVSAAVILLHRNFLNSPGELTQAVGQLGVWAFATGIGYLLATPITPWASHHFGVRRWMILALTASALTQLTFGSVFAHWPLVVASFILGLTSQTLKNCADTLGQTNIDDDKKGQVFTIFDMVFNSTLVLGALIAALLLPANAAYHPVFWGAGIIWLLAVGWFTLSTRHLNPDTFDGGATRRAPS